MKGYKVLTRNMTSPYDNKTQWELGKITKISKDEKLKITEYGLHLYKSLNNISIGEFGSKVFEAETIGDFIEDNNKFCAYKVKLIKEIEPKNITDSHWAYYYCKDIKDDPDVRKNITDSEWAYNYCKEINDDPKVRKYIINSKFAYYYCKEINNDPEIKKYITDTQWTYSYCENIKNNIKIIKNMSNSY